MIRVDNSPSLMPVRRNAERVQSDARPVEGVRQQVPERLVDLLDARAHVTISEGYAEVAGWRFWSDGLGELHVLCEIAPLAVRSEAFDRDVAFGQQPCQLDQRLAGNDHSTVPVKTRLPH